MSKHPIRLIFGFFQAVLLFALLAGPSHGQDVWTANGDNNRTNSTQNEPILNTNNVNAAQFGKVFTYPVDGQVYAQPLYLHAFAMPGTGAMNVLYLATMHNSVYAFDADAVSGTAPLWQVNLGVSVDPASIESPSFGTYTDILHEIGILSTPVIDRTGNTIYVVNETLQAGAMTFFLHALDLTTGAEKLNGPVEIQASVAGMGWPGMDPTDGQVPFVASEHIQRPALLLANGMVYVAFGSHGDIAPWHGWVMAYNASDLLQQNAVFNTTPNGAASAVWQSGRGLAADESGEIYLSTGNGDYNGIDSWGQSVLHLTPTLSVADWFTPAQFMEWSDDDVDFGSDGPILIPGTNFLVAGGKAGIVALIDRTKMGEENALNTNALQTFQAVSTNQFQIAIYNAALWPLPDAPVLYIWGYQAPLQAFTMENGQFNTTASSTNGLDQNSYPFGGMNVSSNGFVPGSGILWVTSEIGGNFPLPATLHAFDAANVARELWNSDLSGTRDTLGNYTKFANPTVANGKVYMPTDSKQVVAYGLLNAPGVTAVVNAASFSTSTIAPGEIVSIFGNRLGPATPVPLSLTPQGTVATTLGGVTATFDGAPAPLLFVSGTQINAVVPFSVAGKSSTSMLVTAFDGSLYSSTLPVSAAAPAVFTSSASGSGQGAILNTDLSINSPSHPAARGSIIVIYATGTGMLSPAVPDGTVVPSTNTPLSAAQVTVTIGGQPATVTYQGAAPGFVAGAMQINARVPSGITPGAAVPVSVSLAGSPGLNTVTVAVQ